MQEGGNLENIRRREGEKKEKIPDLEIRASTVPSDTHPERNEDRMLILPSNRGVGIFDGMGGHAGGEKASQFAKEQVSKSLSSIPKGLNLQETKEKIKQALLDANSAIYQQAQSEKSDMGTTSSVVYIWEGPKGEKKAIVGNVGDSRVYLLRDGKLEQITLDDNLVRSATPTEKEARQLQSELSNVTNPQTQLTESKRKLFESRHIVTQSLGEPTIEPRINTIDFLAGDIMLACSDGIPDNLTDGEISAILNYNKDNPFIAKELIESAQAISRSDQPRSKPDDMTAVIIRERSAKPALLKNKNVEKLTPEKIKPADAKPFTIADIEARGTDVKIRGVSSIAELLDTVTNELQNGIKLESGAVVNLKDLQLQILRGIIKKTPEIKYTASNKFILGEDIVKNIKQIPENKTLPDPIGLQKKIDELADDSFVPIRSRLDWLLIDVAMHTQQALTEGEERIQRDENESLKNLSMTMTSRQREQEVEDSTALSVRLQSVFPFEIIQKLLGEGKRQKVIGEDAYNYTKTTEYRMVEHLARQAQRLRNEVEGKDIYANPTIDLGPLDEKAIKIVDGRINFPGHPFASDLSFDPRNLAIGIVASDLGPKAQEKLARNEEVVLRVYYPHIIDNKLLGKTEFLMTLQDARFLLEKCFKEIEEFNKLGLGEKAVNASLDKYNTLINTTDLGNKELHRHSAAQNLRKL